jgi:hypothetical protein
VFSQVIAQAARIAGQFHRNPVDQKCVNRSWLMMRVLLVD